MLQAMNIMNAIFALVSVLEHIEPQLAEAFKEARKVWEDYKAAQTDDTPASAVKKAGK